MQRPAACAIWSSPASARHNPRKIEIDTGFHKGGRDQATGRARIQPRSDVGKNVATMRGVLPGRQVDGAVEPRALRLAVKRQRMRAAVDDHQPLRLSGQRVDQRVVVQLAAEM